MLRRDDPPKTDGKPKGLTNKETGKMGIIEQGLSRRASLGELFTALGEMLEELEMEAFQVELVKGFAEGEQTGRRLTVETEGCANCSDLPDDQRRSCVFGEVMQGILESFDSESLSLREIKHRRAGPRACRFEASAC